MHKHIATLTCFLGLAGLASASPYAVNIVNFDFETGGFAIDTFSNNPGVVPAGWSAAGPITGAFYGYFNPSGTAYANTNGSGVGANMSGPNVFYFGSAESGQGIEQVLAETFSPGASYTLTVALGSRLGANAFTASLTMMLYAGDTPIAGNTFRNTSFDGTFSDYSIDYVYSTSHAPLAGEFLKIVFLEQNVISAGEVDIDNVRLIASPSVIPEPASFALLAGLGGLGLATSRRRRSAR